MSRTAANRRTKH